jgi:hypothetical protein
MWDELAIDDRTKLAFGGLSPGGKYLGSGYAPAKVIAFNPQNGSIVNKWILPYPESEDKIEHMACIRDNLLMISQNNRIVLHDVSSLKIKAVLSNHGTYIQNAMYLPAEDAIFASSGKTILRWDLRKMPR